jgi:hypothetical protein
MGTEGDTQMGVESQSIMTAPSRMAWQEVRYKQAARLEPAWLAGGERHACAERRSSKGPSSQVATRGANL